MKRGRRLIWHLLFVIFVTGIFLYSPFLIVNNAAFQRWFISTYRPFPPWKVEFESIKITPLPPFAELKGLKLTHPNGHQIEIPSLFLRVKLLRLLRGQLAIDPLKIESPVIRIAEGRSPKEKQKKKAFKLRTLLLIQNLILEKASFKNIHLYLPKEKTLEVKHCLLSLAPALLGGTNLSLKLDDILFQTEAKSQSMGQLNLSLTTNFNQWSKTFPYFDNIDGELNLAEGRIENLPIQEVEAKLHYKNFKLDLKKFNLKMGENTLSGELHSDLSKQTYKLNLKTLSNISIPEIGSERRTFNMAGQLNLDLQLEGEGFKPKTNQGKGALKAIHTFASSPEHPVSIQTEASWQKGVLTLNNGKVTSDDKNILLSGSFDLSPLNFHLKFNTPEFPLALIFDKFADKNLHPIYGKGNVEGSLEGFKKTIHLSLQGKVTEGGYGPLSTDAEAKLDLTYDQLKIDGNLTNQNKITGKTNLVIQYGPKTPGKVRPKQIHLTAEMTEQPLKSLIPSIPVEGVANATLKLDGPPQNFQGSGVANIANASIYNIRVDSLQTQFKLAPKNLNLFNTTLSIANTPTTFTAPLNLNFVPGGVDFVGEPIQGLKIKMGYRTQNRQWTIQNLDFQDPLNSTFRANLQGTLNAAQINLKTKGTLETSHLQFLTPLLREASGAITFQTSIQGSPKNPQVSGFLNFDQTTLSPRSAPYTFEDLEGSLQFQGHQIKTEKLKGKMNGGSFELAGSFQHEELKPHFFDLHLLGNQLYYRNAAGKLRVEYDANVSIKGATNKVEISGGLDILDGRYTKDFNIIEELKKAPTAEKEILEAAEDGPPLHLDLKVKNLGDLVIDNNIGRIELTTDLYLRGTTFNPIIDGNIEVTAGKLHYLGLDFDITRGFMEFRDTAKNPYLEIEGEQDIDVGDAHAHLTAKLYGHTNNLRIDLAGTSDKLGALERKDVISLLLFGMTTTEKVEQTSLQRFQLGPELVAEQITFALQRPIARATGLDILRLETKPTEEGRIRSFHIGKRLSDRLNLEFASEINLDEALQTFRLEYWLTDFLILKGSKEASSEEQSYQLHMGVRFESR